ncbi:unnamed protein product [Triticum turgidum subsp. durum]|uniref:Uncharacterized protein n=1 Tax=Triticum turgidum subsp. durum TaxID=4567 RepID=A0A9R0RS14_TRITD|nr:unnamed protein product [Triticum turgidum subsp. durum]
MAARKLIFGLTAARRASSRASVLLRASPLLEASTSASHTTAAATKPSGGSPWALLFSSRVFSSTPPAQQSAGDVPAPSAVDHKFVSPSLKLLVAFVSSAFAFL